MVRSFHENSEQPKRSIDLEPCRPSCTLPRWFLCLVTITGVLGGCGGNSSSGSASSPTPVRVTQTPGPSATRTVTAPATPMSRAPTALVTPTPHTPTPPPSPTMIDSVSPTETRPAQTDTPTSTPTRTLKAATCGNAEMEPGEECDDGGICIGGENDSGTCSHSSDCPDGECRPLGGDGCAINCTLERLRSARLAPSSVGVVQLSTFAVRYRLSGTQGVRTGERRDVDVVGVDGKVLTRPGEYPVTIKADEMVFEPFPITGLLCACIRSVEAPIFGPGNSGVGVIGCGPQGLSDIDYELVQDHNTTPRDPRNGHTAIPPLGPQLPDDADCHDSFEFPSGLISRACKEGTGASCSNPARNDHAGACNSPRRLELHGGQAAPGSALIHTSVAIGLLNDAGLCRTDLPPGDPRCPEVYGPDCQPCTDDDLDVGNLENISLTTGTAAARILDALGMKGRTIGVGSGRPCSLSSECASGEECVRQCEESGRGCPTGVECDAGDTCGEPRCDFTGCGSGSYVNRCITTAQGTPFNCASLADDLKASDGDGDGLSGATLAAAFPQIDALRVGDNVTTWALTLE